MDSNPCRGLATLAILEWLERHWLRMSSGFAEFLEAFDLRQMPRMDSGPWSVVGEMKSRLVRIATALAGLAALVVVTGAGNKFH